MGKRISAITIEHVLEEHVGNYTCRVKNKAGLAEYTAPLSVNGSVRMSYLSCLSHPCPPGSASSDSW